jgi:MFS family permease
MSSAQPRATIDTSMSAQQWRLLILLVVSVFINYIDRGALGVAANVIQDELKLSGTQIGLLLSAFFWTYASCQLVAGWLVDRYSVALVFGLSYFLWSAATAATGAVSTFATLFAVRLILGLGEASAYPVYSKILAGSYREAQRGKANALLDAGSKLGPAIGLLIGGLMVGRFGWRPFFIVLGLVSMIWLLPWRWWAPHTGRAEKVEKHHEDYVPGWGELLSKRSAWGTFLGLFCGNFAWYFLLTWLPLYFVRERGFSQTSMATIGSLPFWACAGAGVIGGWLSDKWIASGATVTRVRKTFVVGGLAGATLMLPAALATDHTVCVALLCLASASFGTFSCNHWAVTQTLAGKGAAGRWTGLENAFGNVSGFVAPWVAGVILDKTGTLLWAFAACAVLLLVGASSFLFIVGRVEPERWHPHPHHSDAN